MKFGILFVLLAMSGFGLNAQVTPPKGSISGRVVDADTRAPLPGVQVGSRETGYATTDSEGRYTLRDVPPGRWRISISDNYSTDVFLAPLQNTTVAASRDTPGVDFHVRLTAQVSGLVLDEAGNPVQGVRVSAVLREYRHYAGSSGSRATDELDELEVSQDDPARAALTDDRGRYVITRLLAGRKYWILARSPRLYSNPISDSPSNPQSRRKSLVATYYPSSSTMDSAVPLVLHSFENRDGVDIRITSLPSYCLDATLTAGGTPTKMRFVLAEEEVYKSLRLSPAIPGSSQSGEDGRIRLCDLYRGSFHLVAVRYDSSFGFEYVATVPVTISDQDVRDLFVNALPQSTVVGEINWDGPPPDDAVRPTVTIRTFPSPTSREVTAAGLGPGQFSLQVNAGHHYVLVVRGLSSSFYVKDMTYGASRILHKPFVPEAGDAKLRITIGRDAGSINAHVALRDGRPAQAATVLILPANAQSEGELAATTISGIADDSGSFLASRVPPGRYYVLALTDPPPSVVFHGDVLWIDLAPETFARLLRARNRGQLVEVMPGAMAQISLATMTLE